MLVYNRDEWAWDEYRQISLRMLEGGVRLVGTYNPVVKPVTNIVADTIGKIAEDRLKARETRVLDKGLGMLVSNSQEMTRIMREGLNSIASKLEQTSTNIESLQADFNWWMGTILWQLEIQQESLKDILETLQAPLDTQAKELRKRAEFAYLQGWYDEALVDFLESEKKNYQDFLVHQSIGNIFLYRHQPANLNKALEYYLKAGKYAQPRSSYHAAVAFMHAGFVSYLLKSDVEALEYSQRATELHPSLTEAFYNHAKFAVAAGKTKVAMSSLEKAIRADSSYAIKALADSDFDNVENELSELIGALRSEAQREADKILQRLTDILSEETDLITVNTRDKIEHIRLEVNELMAQDTYFGYLKAIVKIKSGVHYLPFYHQTRFHGASRLNASFLRLLSWWK